MSIPARPDYDPDLVITSGLRSAAKEIHALTAERDELKRRLDAIREVVPEGDNTKWSSWQMVTKIHAILYEGGKP